MLIGIFLVGCSCMKKTPKGAVEDFLNQYKTLSAKVLSDLEDVIDEENLTDEQKEKYRNIMKKEYQDLKYEILSESYANDVTTFEVKITVYDLVTVQKDANNYLEEHSEEFMENEVYSNSLFMDYKLDKMSKVTDTVSYTIYFNVTKDDDGNYQVIDLTEEDIEKIHGIYGL